VVRSNPLGSWTVKSYEKFTGERGPHHRKFLTANHVTSEIFSIASSTPGVPFASWKELSAQTIIAHEWVAQTTVHGKISFNDGSSSSIFKIKNFSFDDTF
jgi:hypothetical protein